MQQQPDLFDLYFDLQAGTEPPAIFHRWALAASISAWLGRQCWFPFGSRRIFANQYVMFVGDPGSRKSTAIRDARDIVRKAGYTQFAAKKSGKEKFLDDLMRGMGNDDEEAPDIEAFSVLDTDQKTARECFIVADEFNVFLGRSNLEFLEILGDMWDWDDEVDFWKYALKGSKSAKIWQPTVTILGGNTPTGFTECFPAASIGQGFMSRMILIYGESTGRKITIPPPQDDAKVFNILKLLLDIRQKLHGPMKLQSQSLHALDMIYKSWPELDDQRFKHYSTRRFNHLIKLSMIHAAARVSQEITVADITHANTVLAFAETQMPKAIGELGKAKNAEATNKVMQALYSTKRPLTAQDLWPTVRFDLEKITDLSQILSNLSQADKIQVIELPNRKHGFLPKQKMIGRNVLYVDQSYLKGKELP